MSRPNCMLLAALFLLGSAGVAQAQSTLEGRVTNADTGEGIAGAVISTIPDFGSATTDASGNYRIATDTDERDIVIVRARAADHRASQVTVEILFMATTRADIALAPIEPALDLVTPVLEFDTFLEKRALIIANRGPAGSVLSWQVNSAASFVTSVEPSSGETGDVASLVVVTIDRSGLPSFGSFEDSLSVLTNGGEAVVDLNLENPDPDAPEMLVAFGTEEGLLDFATVIDQLGFFITNAGTGDFDWTITPPEDGAAPWLSLDLLAGTSTAAEPSRVVASVARGELPPAEYTASFTVTPEEGAGTATQVMVRMVVPEVPLLQCPDGELELNGALLEGNVTLRNPGNADLAYSLAVPETFAGWLDLGSGQGSTGSVPAGGETEVGLRIVLDGLDFGEQRGIAELTTEIGSCALGVRALRETDRGLDAGVVRLVSSRGTLSPVSFPLPPPEGPPLDISAAETIDLLVGNDGSGPGWAPIVDFDAAVLQPGGVRIHSEDMIAPESFRVARSELGAAAETVVTVSLNSPFGERSVPLLVRRGRHRWVEQQHKLDAAVSAEEPTLQHSAVAADPVTQRAFIFGGVTRGQTLRNDLIAMSDGELVRLHDGAEGAPAPRRDALMAVVPRNGAVVLAGGQGDAALSDAWRWFEGSWAQITGSGLENSAGGLLIPDAMDDGGLLLLRPEGNGGNQRYDWESDSFSAWDGAPALPFERLLAWNWASAEDGEPELRVFGQHADGTMSLRRLNDGAWDTASEPSAPFGDGVCAVFEKATGDWLVLGPGGDVGQAGLLGTRLTPEGEWRAFGPIGHVYLAVSGMRALSTSDGRVRFLGVAASQNIRVLVAELETPPPGAAPLQTSGRILSGTPAVPASLELNNPGPRAAWYRLRGVAGGADIARAGLLGPGQSAQFDVPIAEDAVAGPRAAGLRLEQPGGTQTLPLLVTDPG